MGISVTVEPSNFETFIPARFPAMSWRAMSIALNPDVTVPCSLDCQLKPRISRRNSSGVSEFFPIATGVITSSIIFEIGRPLL